MSDPKDPCSDATAASDKDPVGVVIVWDTGLAAAVNRSRPAFRYEQPLVQVLNTRGWESLPITRMIGLPLRARPLTDYSGFTEMVRQLRKQHSIPPIRPLQDRNKSIEVLSIEPDVTSDIFGSPRITADCDIVVVREDGKSLKRVALYLIEAFILLSRQTIGKVLRGSDYNHEVRQRLVAEIVTPGKFVTFFEGLRAERVASLKEERGEHDSELQQWLDLDCPVTVVQCGHCAAKTGSGGKPLVLCAGCRKIHYCDKYHQKLDWQEHKHVCKHRQYLLGHLERHGVAVG